MKSVKSEGCEKANRPRGLPGLPRVSAGACIMGFLALVLVLFQGCAGRRVPVMAPDLSNPVYTVAVLPFYNATNDVNGPRMIREELFRRIQNMQYSVMPLAETDSLLVNRMGITLGSQLEMTTPQDVGATLGVDGVIYGYVLNFDDMTTGVYNVKKVRAGFKLIDTATGEVLWSRGLGVKGVIAGGKAGLGLTVEQELAGDSLDSFNTIKGLQGIKGLDRWRILSAIETRKIEEAAIIAFSEKLLTTAFGVHLKAETDFMLKRVLASFPAGRGSPAPARQKTVPQGGAPPKEDDPG